MTDFSDRNPAELIADIEARARVYRTPCGEGSMVWRVWGEGEPLILLHGGFGSWYHWVKNVESLAQHYRVIAADMPGQGDSDDPSHPYDGPSLAEIAAKGVEELTEAEEPLRFACFSFGSVIGGLAAAQFGARVKAFVGIGPAGLGPRDDFVSPLVKITPDMSPEVAEKTYRSNLAILMFAEQENVDDLAVHIQRRNTERNRIRSRSISLTFLLQETYPKIKAPISLIYGSQDVTMFGVLEQRIAALRAVQPEAQVHLLEGIGHWAQYEAPALTEEKLLKALRG